MNFRVLKEPKGFIKLLEVVFSIIAFSVLTSYNEKSEFSLYCSGVISTTPSSFTPTVTTTKIKFKLAEDDENSTPTETSTTESSTGTSSTDSSTFLTTPSVTTENSTSTEPSTTESSIGTSSTDSSTFSTTPSVTTENSTSTEFYSTIEPSTTESSTGTSSTDVPLLNVTVEININYPFRLENLDLKPKMCNGTAKHLSLEDNSSSKSIFFCFVAVTSFLIAFLMIPVYVFQEDFSRDDEIFALADLGLHAILVLFWFSASTAWAAGIANLKYSTGDGIMDLNKESFSCGVLSTCIVSQPSYAGLVASVVFGFINVILYSSNVWFVYKDTHFHQHKS